MTTEIRTQIPVHARLNNFLEFHGAGLRQPRQLKELAAQTDRSFGRIRQILIGTIEVNPDAIARLVGYFGWEAEDFLNAPQTMVETWSTGEVVQGVYRPVNQRGLMRDKYQLLVDMLRSSL